jgi:hypothetical protein
MSKSAIRGIRNLYIRHALTLHLGYTLFAIMLNSCSAMRSVLLPTSLSSASNLRTFLLNEPRTKAILVQWAQLCFTQFTSLKSLFVVMRRYSTTGSQADNQGRQDMLEAVNQALGIRGRMSRVRSGGSETWFWAAKRIEHWLGSRQ